MNEVIVITGGSSGIGLATAAALRKRNCRVYELSRRNVKHENGVLHLSADVTDEAAVKAAIDTVIAREGRVDVLICNAGFGISGRRSSRKMKLPSIFWMSTCLAR